MYRNDGQRPLTQAPPRQPVPDAVGRERWVFTFSIEGDLRFISHRDTLRMFQRAVARASLPVRYTEGFNPHPRLSIPLPRPVGVGSQAESIVIEFEQPVNGEDALHRLEQQMPAGLKMLRGRRLESSGNLQPAFVQYRLELDDSPDADMESRIRNIMESTSVPVERVNAKKAERRIIDVRPYIVAINPRGNAVEFTLRITSSGTAKPAEVASLLGFDVRSINHRILRLEVQWA